MAWKAPALDVERGRCWIRLRRLDESLLAATRAEFLARNPGWEVEAKDVDPFTGDIEFVEYPRDEARIGAAVELSDEVFQSRRLAPLRRNADLFGLTAADLASLKWRRESFFDTTASEGFTTQGSLPCQDEASQLASDQEPCWRVSVTFRRDGIVSSVRLKRRGPPLPMCAAPEFSKARVRAEGDTMNAETRSRLRKLVGPVRP